MKRIALILMLLMGAASSLFAQAGNFVMTSATTGVWSLNNMTVATGQKCFSLRGQPLTIHDFTYQVRAGSGAVSVVSVSFLGTTDGTTTAPSTLSTGTSTAGGSYHTTGVFTNMCAIVNTLTGTGAVIDIAYSGNAPSTISAGTIGAVTSSDPSTFLAGVSGVVADGASVGASKPVGIGGKDGSGNRQDILTDTLGNVGVGVADGLDLAEGGINDAAATQGSTGSVSAKLRTLTSQMNSLLALVNTDLCQGASKVKVPISISSATTVVLQAASASNKAHLCSLFLLAAAADNVAIVEDASGSCVSPDAGVIGGTTTGTGLNLIANEGVMIQNGGNEVAATASTNVNLCIITSTTAQLTGVATLTVGP